ncbi:SDR family oxidoreductase [Evansella cellulosilytica]|uniref:Short-chain dehydrogenase/reductase SDR n=1 Tax=Evansella cellulosilytica (strain ATCC 21833 / DSM 2522 / FERM P-1141 / JCM 9156 / N-4) TaxID=649639 RepID=E6U1H2_EVAC2|nr:SDR family oxidoreductase [Evansella cellulosilytica]ADU29219.1 short-chain dehydrogenase/reductase SDR [Evansella cellulosilytica DSM 2522]
MKLDGSIAVVTGASYNKGIGTAICRKLAKEGADIFFTHWGSEDDWVVKFQDEIIQENGVRCCNLEIDLSESNAPFKILDMVTHQLGMPTILVNNAAHSTRDGYMKLDAETLDNHYAVNMRATFLLSVEFARRLKQQNKLMGRIINMTSGQALGPMTGELAYVATKGAISAFTLSLSAELAPLGITVNAINPGPTDTGWMTDEIKTHLISKFLSGRVGLPEDAARLVSFLASEEAQWITGQIINSEGGFSRA